MKTRTKVILSVVSVLLAIAIILTSIFVPLAVSKKPVINSNEEVIRYIDASSLQNTTYEEKAKQIFKQLKSHVANTNTNGDILFEGELTVDLSQLQNLNFVSADSKEVQKKFKIMTNSESFDVSIVVSYYQNNILLSRETIVTQPYYVEEVDDIFCDIKNERVSMKESLMNDALDNCLALTAIAGIGLFISSSMLILTAVSPQVPPAPVGRPNSFREYLNWMRNKIRSWFVPQTTQVKAPPAVETYKITLNGREFTLMKIIAKTASVLKEIYKHCYRIALVIGQNVWLSYQIISKTEAVQILSSNLRVVTDKNNKTSTTQLNTFTLLYNNAQQIASEAAPAWGLQGFYWDNYHCFWDGPDKKGVYFQHFHPGATKPDPKENRTHSFYGYPKINL